MNFLHRRRPKGQIWVYFDLENPANTQLDPSEFDGMFNWTMTYENNADIHLPYGSYTTIKPGEQPLLEKLNLANKDRLVVWTVSNCGGLREAYVQQLKNHIRVDIFGLCEDYFYQPHLVEERCPKATEECESLLKRYKFFLSFENGNCVDYITEKYWGTPLDLGIVPVVLGGADYKKIAIPGSYIDILDFPSVKALADYLLYLDNNDTAYMEYFAWRKVYKVDGYLKTNSFNKHHPWTCELCAKAQNLQPKLYESLGNFRHSTSHCGIQEDKVYDMIDSDSGGEYVTDE
ncbi:4-galactosyl-N-acetylglucosaminide 3-alpha-L-fucosyltransferase FUT5-like [Oculina patagonica]